MNKSWIDFKIGEQLKYQHILVIQNRPLADIHGEIWFLFCLFVLNESFGFIPQISCFVYLG